MTYDNIPHCLNHYNSLDSIMYAFVYFRVDNNILILSNALSRCVFQSKKMKLSNETTVNVSAMTSILCWLTLIQKSVWPIKSQNIGIQTQNTYSAVISKKTAIVYIDP